MSVTRKSDSNKFDRTLEDGTNDLGDGNAKRYLSLSDQFLIEEAYGGTDGWSDGHSLL